MTNTIADDLTDCYLEYTSLIHAWTGITLNGDRSTMLQGRLRRRITALKLGGYNEYLQYLKKTPEEKPAFVDLVTTNETSFFRTPRVWSYIKEYIPQWHKDHPGQVFRVWSAAASSGEEAYSLSILCQEHKQNHPAFQFEICGTDISNRILVRAREGIYSGRSIENFKTADPVLFEKYMKHVKEDEYQVHADLRQKIRFDNHNLFETWKGQKPFSLILLRNVLIYFTRDDQERVLNHATPLLAPQGVFIIGESESLSQLDTKLEYKSPLIYKGAA